MMGIFIFYPMATGMQVIERLTPLTGLRPTTLDRQFRDNALAGDSPPASRVGARCRPISRRTISSPSSSDWRALIPSDAPEAATALRTMPYRGTDNPPQDVSPPLPTLEDQLAEWIRARWRLISTGKAATDACSALFRTMKLGLCLNPRQAIITFEPPPGDKQLTIVICARPRASAGACDGSRSCRANCSSLPASWSPIPSSKMPPSRPDSSWATPSLAKAGSGFESARASPPKALAPLRDQPRANGTGRLAKLPVATRDDNEFKRRLAPPPKQMERRMAAAENADDLIPLKFVAREPVDGGFTAAPTDYGPIYRGRLSAKFTCEQDDSGRWGVRRRHLPDVAERLSV